MTKQPLEVTFSALLENAKRKQQFESFFLKNLLAVLGSRVLYLISFSFSFPFQLPINDPFLEKEGYNNLSKYTFKYRKTFLSKIHKYFIPFLIKQCFLIEVDLLNSNIIKSLSVIKGKYQAKLLNSDLNLHLIYEVGL